MPVLTRRRGVRVLLFVAAGFPLLLAAGAALLTVVIGQSCTGGGVGDAPSTVAVRDIPARMLAIYQQVGAQYKLPWEILAGIGKEECDHGLDPDPSCTLQPGAKGPGVVNFAGASGPMQVGIGGAAGDEYDALRHFLPDPSLGPHDPTTAVTLAALVVIKDKGAPTGQPIDAYRGRHRRRAPRRAALTHTVDQPFTGKDLACPNRRSPSTHRPCCSTPAPAKRTARGQGRTRATRAHRARRQPAARDQRRGHRPARKDALRKRPARPLHRLAPPPERAECAAVRRPAPLPGGSG